MLPLVHPEGGIVLRKSSVPAGAGTLFVRPTQRQRSVRVSPVSSIGISKELPRTFSLLGSPETDSSTKLIVKQIIDIGNPREPPVPGTLDLLLNIARQR